MHHLDDVLAWCSCLLRVVEIEGEGLLGQDVESATPRLAQQTCMSIGRRCDRDGIDSLKPVHVRQGGSNGSPAQPETRCCRRRALRVTIDNPDELEPLVGQQRRQMTMRTDPARADNGNAYATSGLFHSHLLTRTRLKLGRPQPWVVRECRICRPPSNQTLVLVRAEPVRSLRATSTRTPGAGGCRLRSARPGPRTGPARRASGGASRPRRQGRGLRGRG